MKIKSKLAAGGVTLGLILACGFIPGSASAVPNHDGTATVTAHVSAPWTIVAGQTGVKACPTPGASTVFKVLIRNRFETAFLSAPAIVCD